MFAGVWVNISPGQLTARSQSCNLRLSTACIQRANKEVPSVYACVCVWGGAREREKKKEKERPSAYETKPKKEPDRKQLEMEGVGYKDREK